MSTQGDYRHRAGKKLQRREETLKHLREKIRRKRVRLLSSSLGSENPAQNWRVKRTITKEKDLKKFGERKVALRLAEGRTTIATDHTKQKMDPPRALKRSLRRKPRKKHHQKKKHTKPTTKTQNPKQKNPRHNHTKKKKKPTPKKPKEQSPKNPQPKNPKPKQTRGVSLKGRSRDGVPFY